MIVWTLAAVAAHDLLDALLRSLWGRPAVETRLRARPWVRVLAQVAVQVLVAAGVVVASVLVSGVSGAWPALVAVAVMVGWAWTHARWRPAGTVLGLVLAAMTLADLAGGRVGPDAGLPVVLCGAVVVLFLMESANRVTRSVLSLAGRPGPTAPDRGASAAAAPEGTGSGTGEDIASDETLQLKGGRYIGPMERILVVGLALAGAEGIVAALMAAKGIVRFPEISADRDRGGRAEEFLVGSLASWGLAAGGVLLLWLWQNH